MGRKMLLIINPKAGTQGSSRGIFSMANVFCAAGLELTLRVTQAKDDAFHTVKNTGAEFDYIVCSGGDGTLNEVISGLMTLEKQPLLGYIPSGSTNDFASNLGLIKNDYKGGAKRIVKGVPKAIDIGAIENRYFSYVASFGAFTSITYTTPQTYKNVLGRMAYFLAAPKDIASIRPYKLKVTDKNGNVTEGEYIFGCVANTLSMAGILNLDGLKVNLDDGVFECLLVKVPHNALELNEIVTALVTQDFNCPYFDIIKSSVFDFEFEDSVNWTIDGEHGAFGEKVSIKALNKAIKIVI